MHSIVVQLPKTIFHKILKITAPLFVKPFALVPAMYEKFTSPNVLRKWLIVKRYGNHSRKPARQYHLAMQMSNYNSYSFLQERTVFTVNEQDDIRIAELNGRFG